MTTSNKVGLAAWLLVWSAAIFAACNEAPQRSIEEVRQDSVEAEEATLERIPKARGATYAATQSGITKITEVGISLKLEWSRLSVTPDSQRLRITDTTTSTLHINQRVTANHNTITVTVPASP